MHYLTLPCIFWFGFFNSKTVGVAVFGGTTIVPSDERAVWKSYLYPYPIVPPSAVIKLPSLTPSPSMSAPSPDVLNEYV